MADRDEKLLSRAGAQPKAMGLLGKAGLQLKAPAGAKTFGLQKPKKAAARPAPTSAFATLDDEEEADTARERVSLEMRRLRAGGLGGTAVQSVHAEALEQDASAFDYDCVYDSMASARATAAAPAAAAAEKKVRYVDSIMSAHSVREMENEKVFERKLVKEAQAEAHLYGDKESFMTGAYRRKIAARDEYEAELKRKEAQEAKDDVTKRADLSHFYSNVLNRNLAPDVVGTTGAAGTAAMAAGASGTDAAEAADGAERADGRPPARSAAAATTQPELAGGMNGASTAHGGGGASLAAGDGPSAGSGSGAQPLVDQRLADAISSANSVERPKNEVQAADVKAPVAAIERRNDSRAVDSARERFLARKRQRAEVSGS